MHIGKSYRISEFIAWTKRDIYLLVVMGVVPVVLYQMADLKWLGIPWTVVALLGTATAFIVGFKNSQTYSRIWEARQVWGDILSSSRAWGVTSRDYLKSAEKAKELIYRHLAWLAAMRYQMREPRPWESSHKTNNIRYSRLYCIPEKETTLEAELAKYLSCEELKEVLLAQNKATYLMSTQGKALKELFAKEEMVVSQFIDMEKVLRDFFLLQGRSERIKDFPYPRQFATINRIFVKLFCLLLPFGLLREFDKLNESLTGIMKGNMVWLVVPFSVLLSWIYTSLEQVGDSTECPFEGSPNDVPISQMCRTAEIDLREMLGETELPPPLEPKNSIVL
ncbi:putative membrane protein [Roseimicrobium gellanilyticum]|uniref:Putative membrane protein n=1 Tax=Roseimicrobium gellanilyticum TaxID=748857 RepID=A0A366HRE5_9BACT|nr:bestrophin family ion channel [Roseimicrobium gellanilyticum]RBP46245.1 putative membrane protein [Roseimicrobium gellanilyticum]